METIKFIIIFISLILLVSCAEKKSFIEAENYLSKINLTGSAQDLVIRDNFAYVSMGEAGLSIVNLTDPNNPTIASEVNNLRYFAKGIAIHDTTLYISASELGMYFIGISDPYNPNLVPGTFGSGTFASSNKFSVSDNFLTIANSEQGVIKMDVFNQQLPIVMGSPNIGAFCYDTFYRNDTTFVAAGEMGLYILQIRNGTSFINYGNLNTDGYSLSLQVRDDYIFLADGYGGIKIFQFENSNNAIEINLIIELEPGGYVTDVAIMGDFLAASMRLKENLRFEGVVLYDISDITSPLLMKKVKTQRALSVDFYDHYILCCDDFNGLIIIDIY